VVDPALAGGGLASVEVEVYIDYSPQPVLAILANVSRPDLVKAKIAPNPTHGFSADFTIPPSETKDSNAKRVVEMMAVVSRPGGEGQRRVRLTGSPKCWCGATPCGC
jgi:hypothetical protein